MKIVTFLLVLVCLFSASCDKDEDIVAVDYHITVGGIVSDASSGEIIPDVTISVDFGSDPEALKFKSVGTTDTDGNYTYFTVGDSPRFLWVQFERPGYHTKVVPGTDASTTEVPRTWKLDVLLQKDIVH